MIDHSKANSSPLLTHEFFARSVYEVAPDLIGCYLFTTVGDARVGGMIIETEAYRENDPFAHCFFNSEMKRPKSAERMCGPPGSLYFYYSGQFPCLNIACEHEGIGSAVLIRALLPVCGVDTMGDRRSAWYHQTNRALPKIFATESSKLRNLCNGPGVLCEALGIVDAESLSASSIFSRPFELRSGSVQLALNSGIRIGLAAMRKRWTQNKDPRANWPSVNEFGQMKARWIAADFKQYCRHPSIAQQWTCC